MMTPLWPRIGEQQIKDLDRASGQQITHSIGDFQVQQPNIGNLSRSARSGADPAKQTLDSKKIFLGHALSERAKK